MDAQLLVTLVAALVGLLVVAFVFLAIRQLLLWYWRVNEAVDTLKSIESLLRERLPIQRPVANTQPSAPHASGLPPIRLGPSTSARSSPR